MQMTATTTTAITTPTMMMMVIVMVMVMADECVKSKLDSIRCIAFFFFLLFSIHCIGAGVNELTLLK